MLGVLVNPLTMVKVDRRQIRLGSKLEGFEDAFREGIKVDVLDCP